jgi:MYXO-CTERM domain-containing protein
MRSIHSLGFAVAALLSTVTAPASAQLYSEDFESGAGTWTVSLDFPGAPATDSDDAPVCSSNYLHETIGAGGSRLRSTVALAVTDGSPHCLSAWIRTPSGGIPFLGIAITNSTATTISAEHWLIGDPDYSDNYGGTVTPIIDDGDWHFYTKAFTPDGEDYVLVQLEHWISSAGATYSDFDDIVLSAGACPTAPANSHTTCEGDTPVCLDTAVCVACNEDTDCDDDESCNEANECIADAVPDATVDDDGGVPPADDASVGDGGGDSPGTKKKSSSCTVSGAAPDRSALWLVLGACGLAFTRRRRR